MPAGKKDPNKPKGRMSSYAFYVQYCREEHRESHPGVSVNFIQFSKKCAESWKGMNDGSKKKFADCAEHDKERYEQQMSQYVVPKGAKKIRRKKKDPNAPKRNLSAFFLFSNDERSKVKALHNEWGIGKIAQQLAIQWKAISVPDKAKYDQAAVNDKARYVKALAEYKATGVANNKASSSSSSSSSSSGSSSSGSSSSEEE